jgi:hypothetical protein
MPLRTRLKRDEEKPFAHGAAQSSKSCASSEGRQDHLVINPLPTILRATALSVLGMRPATASKIERKEWISLPKVGAKNMFPY